MQRNPDLALDARPSSAGMPPASAAPGPEALRAVIAAGVRAPSAHNAQPWRFTLRGDDAIECRRVPERCLPHLDFEDGATHVGFGALIENMDLQARALDLRLDVRLFPDETDDTLVATVRVARQPGIAAEPDLLVQIPHRATNRRNGPRQPLADGDADALRAAIAPAGAGLSLVDAPDALVEMGRLVGEGDRVMLTERGMHHDVFEGMRWTRADMERLRYGMDAATLELKKPELAFMKLLGRWPVVRALRGLGAGGLLAAPGRQSIAAASAVALVTFPGLGRDSYVRGGRALQRLWLRASERGVAVQPMATLPFLFARLERGCGEGLSTDAVHRLRALRPRYRALLSPPAGHAEVMLLRLARLEPPSARAPRFDVADLVDEG